MTATDILARSIGLHHPLSEADREQIIDAGLADEDDFKTNGDPPTYTYTGEEWDVEFSHGRPRLIDRIEVPPDIPRSAVREEETRFAHIMNVMEMIHRRPLTDAEIAEHRKGEEWERLFAEAERRDRDEPGRGSESVTNARIAQQRLGRAREILGGPAIVPRRLVGDELDEGDAWKVGRYLIIIIVQILDQVAECRIEFAGETDEMLARVSELLTTAEGLLGIYDLDSDDDDRRVGITLSTSLTDDVDQSHARRI